MTNIFYVLSNLKHDDALYQAGTFLEGEIATFASLVKDGVLKLVEGASTVEEAAKVVAEDAAQEAEQAAQAEAAKPVNTWEAAKPDAENPDASTEVTTEAPAAPAPIVQLPAPGTVGGGDVMPSGDDL